MKRFVRLRFSLAFLFVVVTAIAVIFGRWTERAHRQREAARAFRTAGADIGYSDQLTVRLEYDHDLRSWRPPEFVASAFDVSAESWWRDFRFNVVSIRSPRAEFSDIEMSLLADFPDLEELEIAYTNVTSRGVAYVQKCPHLQSLEMGGTAVDDTSLKYIVKLKQLQRLDLSGTQITDEAVLSLASMPSLHRLQINGLHLAHSTVVELQYQRPDLDISASPPTNGQ